MPKQSSKEIAAQYQKKTQLEHILDIPDTYIGSIEKTDEVLYVFDDKTGKIVRRNIEFIHGFERIFEEILLNAFDQTVRPGTGTDKIKVNIDIKNNEISVQNNGRGVPVIFKEDLKVYIPEMIFGQLLTSGNYNKNEKRIVGGKNGYGAKLANIFSTKFKLETVDEERKKKFKMVWKNNMKVKEEPKIKDSDSKGMTKITFNPDLKRFGIKTITPDMLSYMKKRVYDIAVNSGKKVSVYFNDKKVPIKKFEDYIKLYLPDDSDKELVIDEDTNQRWAVGLFMNDSGFEQVSFVNGISTNSGGTHVKDVSDKIINDLINKLKKKKLKIKNADIKNRMFIFVKSFIENPSFNSQTKEQMISKPTNFGSRWELPKKFSNGLVKTGIMEEVETFAQFKENKELKKTDGKVKKRLIGIEKLEDANWAGDRSKSKVLQTRLILTEGDSAKTFAMEGLAVIGRDKYGIFPLKGKLLNVKDQSNDKILKNQEISNLKQILGLRQGHKYKSLDELRYGGIIILTDQDVDGSHIKGLVMNLFHTFWPELLKLGFIKTLVTPIVKAFKKGKDDLIFYTLTDFEKWKAGNHRGWTTKYYKGLGTSKKGEAKDAMRNIEEKLVTFSFDTKEDNDALNLGFNKSLANDRKKWLLNYDRNKILEQTQKSVPVKDFINKDLIHFSNYDNHRSIPSIIDGLKPTQRKILYTGLKYLTSNEIKVAQFSAKVAEKTDYHHGESSIVSTVVGMAQTFVGANNCNIYLPNGQFGTRLRGGKDHSSERYIYTNLTPITKKIFNKLDDKLLNYIDSDGMKVEPEYYTPSVPMILVNGTLGIGTGFSTEVLPHKMEDVVQSIRDRLDGKKSKTLKPWYRSFKGTIEETSEKNKYLCTGNYTINMENNTITVTELPIGTWTENYKKFIESCIIDKSNSDSKQKQFIVNYESQSTTSKVKFILEIEKTFFKKLVKKGKDDILKLLKLSTSLSENNMYLFDKDGKIKKFKSTDEILDYYFNIRLHYYDLRKKKMVEDLTNKVEELKNKVRFIRMVKSKKIDVLNTTEDKLNKDLEKHQFTKLKNEKNEYSYDYLITMAIRTLTLERANKMEDEYKSLINDLEALMKKDFRDMWREDLDDILKENEIYNNELEIENEKNTDTVVDTKKKRKVKIKKAKK